jgi:hypothetical protein
VDLRRAFERELRNGGARLVEGSGAGAQVDVTLSENLESYVWVAEIHYGDKHDVLMVTAARQPEAVNRDNRELMAVEKKLLLEREEPILDIAHLEIDLLVLGRTELSLYRRQHQGWELHHSLSLTTSRIWPRDMRGRLELRNGFLQIYLPGAACTGTLQPEFRLECKEGEGQWPLEFGQAKFIAGRNFFVKKNLPPFFSVAGVEEQGNALWIFAGVDGRAHLHNAALDPVATFEGWGSDIASVATACGSGNQVLVTGPSDSSARNTVQVFEIMNRQAVAVSSPLELPGPVTALWPTSSGGEVVAVTRDLKTGRHAAFRLEISCRH